MDDGQHGLTGPAISGRQPGRAQNAEVISAAGADPEMAYPARRSIYAGRAETAYGTSHGRLYGRRAGRLSLSARHHVLADLQRARLDGRVCHGAKEPGWQFAVEKQPLVVHGLCQPVSDIAAGRGPAARQPPIWSYETLVMDCEIWSCVLHLARGVCRGRRDAGR